MTDGWVGELPITFIEASGMRLETAQQRGELERILLREKFDWLIIEPLRRVHSGNENDNSEMAEIHNTLRRWSNAFGITITICHHTGKLNEYADMNRIASWSRGNTDLATIVDTAMFVEETRRETGKRVLRLLRAGRFPPVDALLVADLGDPCEGGRGFEVTRDE